MVPQIRDYQGQRIHLIGIGGSSMSGLAEMLMDEGYSVSGSIVRVTLFGTLWLPFVHISETDGPLPSTSQAPSN